MSVFYPVVRAEEKGLHKVRESLWALSKLAPGLNFGGM